MKLRILKIIPAALIVGGVALAVGRTSQSQTLPAAGANDLRTISLPQMPPPPLPLGDGRDSFMIQCAICHSQRYVTMQPRFSRKVWTDEVNKMINTYKAQIPADQVTTIVDYLMVVRGAEAGKAK